MTRPKLVSPHSMAAMISLSSHSLTEQLSRPCSPSSPSSRLKIALHTYEVANTFTVALVAEGPTCILKKRSRARSLCLTISVACDFRIEPSSVNSIPRPFFLKSTTPSSLSSARIALLNPCCEMKRLLEACENDLHSAISKKYSRTSMRIPIPLLWLMAS